ncbi:hypothetical protein KAFR_0F03820 [Kazachstania africana CBS 2517]|uniref:AB hydrolase-1 domain-containing protein n=1 Tax=Kazachstania africana (strain ATCC 22294 / BCRC 22015 / CBS 2517 / CECT 1963 / NBRC 1671 / NRRL Y-8276) TaxID=1071382 RepID=H2AX78_KAZAF|nr:hypothetical protein KAFR_0F03820 [Kazachstania africana CBS 2517]CCF58978.1 hypothetical protein KAFR_0F03820 [Kazachstania africana CBS 2517]
MRLTSMMNKPVSRIISRSISSVPLSYELLRGGNSQQPIVILHGLLGNKGNNRRIGKNLNEQLQRDIYLVDLRNHGNSPHSKPHNYDSMSNDVINFVDKLEMKSPTVIGHSMGAKVGMSMVLKKASVASGLICIENSPVCTAPNGKFSEYVRTLQKICQDSSIRSMTDADKMLSSVENDKFKRQFLLTVLKRDNDNKITSKVPLDILRDAIIKGYISEWPFDPRHDRWTGPTLFIRGTESPFVADEYIPTIGQYFPRFEIRDVEGNHFINAVKPDECSDYILDFITRNDL